MNQIWIAALLPLFLSPQSESKDSTCCSDADKAKCEKVCQEMKEKMKACKDLARQELEKAMEVARKAAHEGMRGAHEAMQQAHQELAKALQSAHASGWWDGKKFKTLGTPGAWTAYTVNQDGELAKIWDSQQMKELGQDQKVWTKERDADDDSKDSDDDSMAADEAAEAAERQAEEASEAAEAAEQAQEKAAEELGAAELKKLHLLGYAAAAPEENGSGQSRGLEKRIAALEERLGVHNDSSSSSLEERVAALERLAMPHPAPRPLTVRTPRPPRPARAFALPRTPAAVIAPDAPELPSAPEAPRVIVARPGSPGVIVTPPDKVSARPAMPAPDTAPEPFATPTPPRAAETPQTYVIRRPPADMRREIESRMRKMRDEMDRLRQEMNRLKEELGRQEGQDR